MSYGGAEPTGPGNLVQELTSHIFPMFSTLVAAASYAGLVDTLATTQDITVLCPTNLAFSRAGIEAKNGGIYLRGTLLSQSAVKEVLWAHVYLTRNFPPQTYANTKIFASKRQNATGGHKTLTFHTDDDMRTTVDDGSNSACVLLSGLSSTNANFAVIGRVLGL